MDRVVVKDNWIDATTDKISEFGWSCVGWFVLGGMAVTGVGAVSGYMSTPQGQDPVPLVMEHTTEAHAVTWEFIGTTIESTWNAIQDARPEA